MLPDKHEEILGRLPSIIFVFDAAQVGKSRENVN